MLDYGHHFPADAKDGDPVVLLLHGRGSNKDDLLGLVPHLPANALIVHLRLRFRARSGDMAAVGPGIDF